ncbi:MAG: 4Fe-4S double cluster binding domain-containing protein [Dehalococcoidales bacterium]|nr:4Fe-4S double cluster binding domain-containing protein [Dehalococcoidales bacterium]
MTGVINTTQAELEKNGFKVKTVSITHLSELQEDIDKFHRQGLLDKQLSDSYLRFQYGTPEDLPGATIIFIIAVPQPITRAQFTWQGTTYEADIPPTYIGKTDDTRVKDILTSVLKPAGYRLARARLPVKTLAVRSGLMQYGRNNITYVPGMGSFQRLVAFYSDCPTERDDWQELKVMKACETCFKCLENCPTQCISTDRFLIHAENCLTWLNESEGDFPDWVKPDWHNALIGCMHCQLICPVNKTQIKKVADGPIFSEKETGLLLQKIPSDKLAEVTRDKLVSISANDWYEVLARNLRVLIESRLFTPHVP